MPPLPLRRNVNFQMLWIGQVLSDLGSHVGSIAYPLLILALTHSPVIAGVVATVTASAAFLVRLPAGALADRVDRRRAMIVCDSVRAVALALLATLVVIHEVSWFVVLGVAIVDAIGDTIFTPTSTAALPAIVANSQLESAWAATEARQFGAGIGGPALGGVLFSLGRSLPFVGDAISYAASVVTSTFMRGHFRPPPSERTHGLWHEAFEGVRMMVRDPLMRAVLVQAPLINFAFTGLFFTVTVGLRSDGKSGTVIGIVNAVIMVGGLLGALAAPKFQGWFSLQQMVVILTSGGCLMFALAAWLMPSPFIAIPIALPLFFSPAANAALIGALLREAPPAMHGRATNALMQVATSFAVLAPITAGFLVADLNANWAMGIIAMALAVSAVMAVSLKGLRRAEAARAA
jgi:MFS family permease